MSQLSIRREGDTIYVSGKLTVSSIEEALKVAVDTAGVRRVDLSGVERCDTYGALFLKGLVKKAGLSLEDVVGAPSELSSLFSLVGEELPPCRAKGGEGPLLSLSRFLERKLVDYLSFFDFLGRLVVEGVFRPGDFEVRSFFRDVEGMGLRALGIISVLSFLIGVVIAYQSSAQLARFGANIFIVDLVVLSVVRELGPLVVAILISGRSASSYTATLGLMRVNEEIDALEVMGISPYATLVLPRILSMMVVTPLLVVCADVVGVAGGMLVAKLSLGIDAAQFVHRMGAVLKPRHFFAGFAKAPVFGLFVALVGTWKGFEVEKRAESIGFRVIESVVASLFGVIVIDAVFSVIYRWLGI